MRCEAFDAPAQRLAAPAQLDREHEAGELGLCIDLHRPVTALCLQIVEIDRALARCDTAERDDPRIMPFPEQGQQMRGEIGRAHVELQSLMRISYAVFCLKKKKQ